MPQHFHVLADHLPDPLVLVTARGEVIEANRAAQVWCPALRGARGRALAAELGLDAAILATQLQRWSRTSSPVPGVLVPAGIRTGARIPVTGCRYSGGTPETGALILIQATERHRLISRFRDLTNTIVEGRRTGFRAHEEAVRREQHLIHRLHEQRLEGLGTMAGSIAHDFNNLLTSILGYADLARSFPGNPPRTERSLQQIVTASGRAADLVRQLLAYSGKGRFRQEQVLLNDLLLGVGDLLRVSAERRHELVFALDPTQPACMADQTQLHQVAMNLVANASDAMAGATGSIRLSTGRAAPDPGRAVHRILDAIERPGPLVYFEVQDEGPGMAPEVVARIFEPFFTTKRQGHGLGLAAVHGIVRGHRGALEIETAPGRGCRIRVLLPALVTGMIRREAPSSAPQREPGFQGRVLVVDDEPGIRDFAGDVLKDMGFTVDCAENGLEAMRLLAPDPAAYRFILLDMTMPVMDGKETLTRARMANPGIRVLLSSGHNEQVAVSSVIGSQGIGFIQKPYAVRSFVEAVTRLLA